MATICPSIAHSQSGTDVAVTQEISLSLTPAQQRWLRNHPTIHIGLPIDSPPFSFLDGSGNLQGLIPDHLDIISEYSGLQFEPTPVPAAELIKHANNNSVDVIPLQSSDSEEFPGLVSRKIIDIQNVIITRQDAPFIAGNQWLENKKVITVQDSQVYHYIDQNLPNIDLIPMPNTAEALLAVSEGKGDAFVGGLFAASYAISEELITNLKIAGQSGFPDDSMRFAIRKDLQELRAILNKSILSINSEESEAILRKWLAVRFDKGPETFKILKWVGLVVGALLLLLGAAGYWNRQLRQAVSERTEKLQEANDSLNLIKTQFEAVYNHHYQLTGLLDPDGRLLMANKKAAEFGGFKPEDIVGTIFWDTPFWTHSEEAQKSLRQAIDKALKGEFVQFETTHPTTTGEIRDFDFCLTPVFDENGKVIYLVPEGYDITERKRVEKALRLSEERNKAIVENSPIAIILMDLEGIPISSNKAFQDLLGYNSDELHRITPRDYTHPDDKDASHELYLTVMSENPPRGQLEKRYIHHNGTVIWVNLHVNLVKDTNGQPEFIMAMAEDISTRKEAEQAMKDQLSELRRWQEVTIGREERMQKLKEEVDELAERLGESRRYDV